tara:strand:+ start:438 stop:1541 length:1104 start_codon:yes stop_codon:yes gene_type:complete
VYHSFLDVSDNSFALFVYVINNQYGYRNIWLVDDINKEKQYHKIIKNYTQSDNYRIVRKNSIKGLWFFLKSKYIFHTHGIYNKLPLLDDQINFNLWHGMPLKNIGYLDNNKLVPKSNYLLATSLVFQKIMSKSFNIVQEKVLITGQPRNDFILDNKFNLLELFNLKVDQFQKSILWMPTYRKSIIGDIRNDGNTERVSDFFSNESLITLNKSLKDYESICFIKLHPMDYMHANDFIILSNIKFLDNSFFEKSGVALYSVFSSIDLLLTDFSSVYIDFLLVDKPIAFVFSDFNEYLNSRGFVFDNAKEFMPGEIITNMNELVLYLENLIVSKNDVFILQRNEIKNIFHEVKSNFSQNLFNKLVYKNAQ